MSFGKPCKNRGSESLMVDDFDLFRGALEICAALVEQGLT